MLTATLRSGFTRPLHLRAFPARTLATAHPGEQALVQEGKVVARTKAESKTVEVRQQHLGVSPKKLKLTASLVHKRWLPDAIAQMKFSPRKLTGDIENLIRRGAAIASERLSLHPEELVVSEAMVNTGPRRRYVWIQGRGRTGMATKRYSHLVIRVKAVDFDQEIMRARDPKTRQMWIQRKEMAEAHRQARAQMDALKAQAKKSSSSKN